jgi:hypothetical protein
MLAGSLADEDPMTAFAANLHDHGAIMPWPLKLSLDFGVQATS